MTSRDFVYWLQGLFELAEPLTLNKKQTELIKKHLNMVFYHEIDPSMGDQEHQGKLDSIHNGANPSKEEQASSTLNTAPPQLPSIPIFLENLDQAMVKPSSTVKNQDIKYRS